jgi:hypothetical protein
MYSGFFLDNWSNLDLPLKIIPLVKMGRACWEQKKRRLNITNVLDEDNILTPKQNIGRISLGRLMVAQLESAFPEMPRGWSFGLDRPVRVTRGNPLGMTDPGWYAQHRGAALCSDATPSCFVAGAFPRLLLCAHQHAGRCFS